MNSSEKVLRKYSVAWSESKRKDCKLCAKKPAGVMFCRRHSPRASMEKKEGRFISFEDAAWIAKEFGKEMEKKWLEYYRKKR